MGDAAGGRQLLFIAPDWPHQGATGLAMRAWAVTAALARRFEVQYFVPAPLSGPPEVFPENVRAAHFGARIQVQRRFRATMREYLPGLYPRWFREPPEWATRVRLPAAIAKTKFDRVHVFRLSQSRHAEPFLGVIPCQLDLDESESRTMRRIAELYRQNGKRRQARLWEHEAEFLAEQECGLRRFETVYVSSGEERAYLAGRGIETRVLPNTVPVPAEALPPARGEGKVLLLVGNLNYYPSEDAASFLVREVVPRLRTLDPGVRVKIAGRGPGRLRQVLSQHAGVEWLGFVPDLEPLYRECDLVVTPVRAGGGTRIKILEAFAHCRAVVSTRLGAEGLDAKGEEHLLYGDSAEEFAAACVRALKDPGLRGRIARGGYELVSQRYSSAALAF